jgi:hypothetical protein
MADQQPQDEPYALIPSGLAKEMIDAFRVLTASGTINPGYHLTQLQRLPSQQEPGIRFKNTYSETMPGYACMQVIGTEDFGDKLTVLTANQPADTDGTSGTYLFNGPYEVGPGKIGTAQKGRWAIAIGDGTAATSGDRWSPVVSAWTIEPDSSGPFVMAGDDQLDTDLVQIFIEPASSGGGAKIEFEIISITTATSGDYYGLKVATVEIRGAPCDRTALIGTEVEVVDHAECIFDLPSVDLVGVRGWAFEGVYLSLDPEAEEGELTPCHWAALNRCCADGEGA